MTMMMIHRYTDTDTVQYRFHHVYYDKRKKMKMFCVVCTVTCSCVKICMCDTVYMYTELVPFSVRSTYNSPTPNMKKPCENRRA